jgi:hypothetical protein
MTELRAPPPWQVLEGHGRNIAKAATASVIARRYFQLLKARRSLLPRLTPPRTGR